MQPWFLLKSDGAKRLYQNWVQALPVIDFHNHLSVENMRNDRQYGNITELWLSSDPYKHRLMRICGVKEHYITGEAAPYEKFEKYCEIFPLLAGNPVYDWSRMELSQIFGIEELPTKERARYLYDRTGEMLRSAEFSNNAILRRFSIEYQSPVTSLLDDLSLFSGSGIAPSLLASQLLSPSEGFLEKLQQVTGKRIADTVSYVEAVAVQLDAFSAAGCRFADHSLDADFFTQDRDGTRQALLVQLGREYAKRNWTLLLHLGAKRHTSTRLAQAAGPAGGYAAAGSGFPISPLCDLLDRMEQAGGLPDTVLFPLNLSDQAPMSVLQGSFSQDGTASKVQLGPAWWWCDHTLGIRNTLSSIASFGVVSQFIGMTTDSCSILSFIRHDYFRRLLCTWLEERNGDWELPPEQLGEIARRISYQNAKDKLTKNGRAENGQLL